MTPARTPSPAPTSALAVVVHAPGGVSMALPPVIADAGEAAARFTLEFFASRLPNANTRKAYGRAVFRFCAWCHAQAWACARSRPHLEGLDVSQASVKLTASALRHWLDYLTERGVLTQNPALSVRTARLVVTEGKTPVLERAQARKLFASLDSAAEDGHVLALRDRALFAVMLYGFVRVGAAVRMSVRDFDDSGEQAALVLHEKGGKERRIPCHHKAREFLRAHVAAAGFEPRAKGPLFQTAPGRSAKLSGEPMTIDGALRAVKRRCADAGLPASISNHSFRATGITLHQETALRPSDISGVEVPAWPLSPLESLENRRPPGGSGPHPGLLQGRPRLRVDEADAGRRLHPLRRQFLPRGPLPGPRARSRGRALVDLARATQRRSGRAERADHRVRRASHRDAWRRTPLLPGPGRAGLSASSSAVRTSRASRDREPEDQSEARDGGYSGLRRGKGDHRRRHRARDHRRNRRPNGSRAACRRG